MKEPVVVIVGSVQAVVAAALAVLYAFVHLGQAQQSAIAVLVVAVGAAASVILTRGRVTPTP